MFGASLLVAGGADGETTVTTDPVEIENGCLASVAQFTYAFHSTLPHGKDWGR